jgi:hypothetical protein
MIIIVVIICVILFFHLQKNRSPLDPVSAGFCPVVKNQGTVVNDISIKPVGCYINTPNMFFTSCINPYSTKKETDSGIEILKYPDDITSLVNRTVVNGYTLGNDIISKYPGTDYSKMSLLEYATLGYLSGYKYMSITKNTLQEPNVIFFSYSPPMNSLLNDKDIAKPDYPYALTTPINGFTNENENAPGKEIGCGYPCLQNGTPQTIDDKQYMCGSIVYPTIRSPPKYSVYEIFEKT